MNNGKSMVREYISYTPRPFTSSQIVADTGICYETIKKYLQDLVAEDYIKKIGIDKGKNVYVYNRRKEANQEYKVNQKHYTLESVQEAYRRQLKKMKEEFDDLL